MPSAGSAALHDGEGVGGEIQNQQKENLHRGDDHRSISKQSLIGFVAQAQNESVTGQEQRPEEQRAFLPRPEHGKLIGGGQVAVAVMENVGDGEVVVERGEHQHDARQQHRARKWRFRRGGPSRRGELRRRFG